MVSPIAEARVTSTSKTQQHLRIEASDPRSDNCRRVVDLDRTAIVIRRVVARVSMAIRIEPSAYRGVVFRVVGLEDGRFHYEVKLLHRDPDLSVALAESEDMAAAEAQWREWVGFLGLPALVGRTGSSDVQVNIDCVDLDRRVPASRRCGRATAGRRSSFLRRRKVGGLLTQAPGFSNPRVLFPGSKLDR
jgi:Family of unknown function (DUF6101)